MKNLSECLNEAVRRGNERQAAFERTKSEPTNQAPAVSSLPWYVSDSHFTKHNVILGNNPEFGAHICTLPEFKDGTAELADFIVAACNSHAANLARIAELEDTLRRINEYWPAGTCPSELWNLINNALTDGAKYENEI